MVAEVIQEVGAQTGLKVREQAAFGNYRGYLVALGGGQYDWATGMIRYRMLVGFPERQDTPRVAERMDKKELLKTVKGMGNVVVDSGFVSINFAPKWRKPKPENLRRLLDTVVNRLSETTPAFSGACAECGNSEHDVVLVNGFPKFLCSPCLDRMAQDVMGAHRAQSARSPRYGQGLLYAVPAMFATAMIYAIIAYATGYVLFLIGVMIGLAVSYALAYGAKKITVGIIGLAMILTILAVVIGEVLFVVFVVLGEGLPLSYLGEALGIYLTEFFGDFALAMVTAIIGAALAAGYLWGERKKQRVAIEVVT